MANPRINVQIDQTKLKRQLTEHVIEKYAKPATQAFVSEYRDTIKQIIILHLKKGKTWRSIEGDFEGTGLGDLHAVLGLADPISTMDDFADFLFKIIDVQYLRRKIPGLYVTIKRDGTIEDFDGGSYISGPSGILIPWLKWLLLGEGTVPGYSISFNLSAKESGYSRSGRAVMRAIGDEDESYQKMTYFDSEGGDFDPDEDFNGDGGGGDEWSIEPSLALMGTPKGSNFIIEAFEDGRAANQIFKLFQDNIIPILRRAQR